MATGGTNMHAEMSGRDGNEELNDGSSDGGGGDGGGGDGGGGG